MRMATCLLCLAHLPSCEDNFNVEENRKIYQDIFDCCKYHLKGSSVIFQTDSLNWNCTEDNPSPFCQQCFKSSEKLYRISQQLKELKSNLERLVDEFAGQIEIRVSHNEKKVKEEYDSASIKEDVEEIDSENEEKPELGGTDEEILGDIPSSVQANNDVLPSGGDFPCDDAQDEIDYDIAEPFEVVNSTSECDKRNPIKVNINDSRLLYPRVLLKRVDLEGKANTSVAQCKKAISADNLVKWKPSILRRSSKVRRIAESPPESSSDKTDWKSAVLRMTTEVRSRRIPENTPDLSKGNMYSSNSKTNRKSVKLQRTVKVRGVADEYPDISDDEKDSSVDKTDLTYTCTMCGKAYGRKNSLVRHMRNHGQYSCSRCSKSFENRDAWLNHKSEHPRINKPNADQSVTCNICGKTSINQKAITMHMKSVHGVRDFQCEKCGLKFVTTSHLKRHMETHSNKESILCTLCGKKFFNQKLFNTHMKYWHGKKDFQCETCGMKFACASFLKCHLEIHKEGSFVCDVCGKEYGTAVRLKSHKYFMHTAVKKVHKCDICEKTSSTNSQLKKHVDAVHRNILKCKCTICGLMLRNNDNLKKHMELHKSDSERKRFVCGSCGKGFRKKENLHSHEETHKEESERTKFKCEICGDKFFTQRSNFYAHRSRVHLVYTGGILTCHKCKNKFYDEKHMLKHRETGPKTIKCNFCQETFRIRCDLLKHYQNIHPTEDLPHQCEKCECLFSSTATLKGHLTETNACCIPFEN